MRRLPKDGLVFHVYCPGISAHAFDALAAAAAELQWPLLDRTEDRYPSWHLGTTSAPLSVSLNSATPWSELHVSVHDNHLAAYGAERLIGLFAWLSDGVHARLGRTTPAVAPGFVQPEELEGHLEFVDWFQYWGEPIVHRWGMPWLSAGPFHRVEPRDAGACVLLLSAEPDDETMSRRAAADYLGIPLRPIYAQIEAGKKVQIPWR